MDRYSDTSQGSDLENSELSSEEYVLGDNGDGSDESDDDSDDFSDGDSSDGGDDDDYIDIAPPRAKPAKPKGSFESFCFGVAHVHVQSMNDQQQFDTAASFCGRNDCAPFHTAEAWPETQGGAPKERKDLRVRDMPQALRDDVRLDDTHPHTHRREALRVRNMPQTLHR